MKYTIEEIQDAIQQYGTKTKAAEVLGVPRSTMNGWLKQEELALDNAANELGFPAEDVTGYWVKSKTGSYYVRRPSDDEIKNLSEYFIESFNSLRSEFYAPNEYEQTSIDVEITIYPLADLHIGMIAWAKETGVDWDLKIAEKVILETFSKLVSQSKPTKKALIVNLGDYFHMNDSKNETPANGHKLDVDSRYSKIIMAGVKIMKSIIEIALEKHETIEIKSVKGNHDPDSSVALVVAFSLAYENEPRVIVDITPRQLIYYNFGSNIFGFFHGHTMKPEHAAMTLACEAKEFSSSKYRYMMHGHIHTTTSKEFGNILVESFQTIIPRDAYAANSGYFSGRSLSAITYHKENGEIGRHKVNL